MAEGEEVRNDKILIQQLPSRGISSVVYTLKVPNVFTLAEYDNTTSKLYSPTFEFVNSIWNFRIDPSTNKKDKYFMVHLERICIKKLNQQILYEIELLDGEDEVYDDSTGVRTLVRVEGEVYLSTFTNKNSSHDKRDVLTLTVHLMYVESTELGEDQTLIRKIVRKVLEEIRDIKITIHQLPKRKISSAVYTLKVPNVFTLEEFNNTMSEFYSPNFEFVNSTWRFHIKSDIDEEYNELDLYLERINFKKVKQRIFYELDGEDEVYGAYVNVEHFRNNEEKLLRTFNNEDAFHDKPDVLTLTVHLIYVESTEEEENQLSMTSSEGELSSDEEDEWTWTVVSSSKIKGLETLSENLKQMFLDGRMCDIVLKAGGKEFNVHKVIMAARSPVFASMFQHDLAENKTNGIDIPDCTAESFEVFLHYLYTSSVETLSTSNVCNVYYAADKYQVDDLKEMCVQFMKENISVDTFCDVIDLSLRHGESELQKIATDFFCQNVKEIIKTVQWLKYMETNTVQANELLIKLHKA